MTAKCARSAISITRHRRPENKAPSGGRERHLRYAVPDHREWMMDEAFAHIVVRQRQQSAVSQLVVSSTVDDNEFVLLEVGSS